MPTMLMLPLLLLFLAQPAVATELPSEVHASAAPRTVLTCKQSVPLATRFIRKFRIAKSVDLENPDIAEGKTICHIMFRRNALVLPAVVTVDIDRNTGAACFRGDE